jgi:DNA-binding MarR family transcriptional regulator
MGLAEDIQQKRSFRSEFQKATVNILYSSSWVQGHVKNIVGHENITPQQYNILRILRGSEAPISTLQIRERMLDKMSDSSRLVERLLRKGLVHKKMSTVDKRLVDVSISEKGLKVLQKLDERNEEFDRIARNLSQEEAHTLNRLLDKLRGPR